MLDYINSYKMNEGIIWQNFDIMVDKWRKREKNWDIKIVDWIIDNYKDIPLFEDIYHPNDILLNRICKQLLELLNIKDVNYEKVYHMGCAMEIFILPQVKHALEMTWQKEKIKLYNIDYSYHDRQPISYEQYVQEYIWKVFGKMLL